MVFFNYMNFFFDLIMIKNYKSQELWNMKQVEMFK